MKNILIYALSLAMFSLVACHETLDNWADPQGFEQEEMINANLEVAPVSPIDMATVTAEKIALFTVTAIPSEAIITKYKLTLDGTSIDVDEKGLVATEELKEVVARLYGKRPTERTIAGVVSAYMNLSNQIVKSTANVEVKVTPSAPVISSAYYLVGDMLGWDAEHMLKFNHSDQDVYEDPVFTLIFTTTADNQYWKIIPQDNVDAEDGFWANPGVVGVAENGDDSMEGSLVNKDAGAGMIAKAGMYSITLNMMDYTYTIKEIVPEYYIVGAMQGWNSTEAGMTCMLYPQSKMIHSYTTQYNGDANMKLWLGSDFGNWDVCFGATTDGDNSASGSLVSTGAGAMVCPEKGAYYTFTVDFSSMSYTWTKLDDQAPAEYENISLIGAFNSWGEDADMEEVTPHNWYIAGLEVTAGGIKFRANHKWDISWGGTINLTDQNYGVADGSDDITISAGTYNVYFNDITSEFVFKTVN